MCLRIFVLARRRAQGWQEFLETAQHNKSTDDCLLLAVFCHLHLLVRTTCSFQRDWGAAARKFSAKISFWCQTGFQSTKEPFLPTCSQFLSHWDWKKFRFGGKKILLVGRSFFWFSCFHTMDSEPLRRFWWQCHLVCTTITLMSPHILTGAQGGGRYVVPNKSMKDSMTEAGFFIPVHFQITFVLIIFQMIP